MMKIGDSVKKLLTNSIDSISESNYTQVRLSIYLTIMIHIYNSVRIIVRTSVSGPIIFQIRESVKKNILNEIR